jgi:hypothetical protein
MDLLNSHLDFLASHPFGVVFFSSLIEAAGIPFPSRVILILAPAFRDDWLGSACSDCIAG